MRSRKVGRPPGWSLPGTSVGRGRVVNQATPSSTIASPCVTTTNKPHMMECRRQGYAPRSHRRSSANPSPTANSTTNSVQSSGDETVDFFGVVVVVASRNVDSRWCTRPMVPGRSAPPRPAGAALLEAGCVPVAPVRRVAEGHHHDVPHADVDVLVTAGAEVDLARRVRLDAPELGRGPGLGIGHKTG